MPTTTTRVDTQQPFSRAAALRAGISDGTLRREHQQILHGWWLDRRVEVTGELLRQTALRACPPGSFLSHHSAAAQQGAIVPSAGEVHVGTTTTARIAIDGVHWHRFKRSPETRLVRGLRCTTVVETFIDLGWSLSLLDLVIYADSLARNDPELIGHFRARAVRSIGRGAVRAREAAELARPSVESPQESRLRMLIVLAGLPEPQVNHEVRDDSGHVIYRLDLACAQFRVAFEYDGRHHIRREGQWEVDLKRRERLESMGWRVLVFVAADVHNEAGRTVQRVRAAMLAAGMSAGTATAEWRRHFDG